MIADYSELIAEVAERTGQGDLPLRGQMLVGMLETYLNKKLRTLDQELSSSVTTDSNGDASLPSDLLEIKGVYYEEVRVPRRMFSPVEIDFVGWGYYTDGATLKSNLEGRDLVIRYYAEIPSLHTNSTNWLLTAEPEIYLSGLEWQAFMRARDFEAANVSKGYLDGQIDLLRVKDTVDVTSTDWDIAQIVEFMEQAGEDIAKRAEWSSLYSSDTVSGSVSSHSLPSDFQEFGEKGGVYLNKTEGTYTPVRPCTDPTLWDFLVQRPSSQLYYMLRGDTLEFSDALDSDGAKFTYISSDWVSLDGGGTGTAIAANADTFRVPERLVHLGAAWRWLREKGMPYDDYVAEFEADLAQEIKADRGAA